MEKLSTIEKTAPLFRIRIIFMLGMLLSVYTSMGQTQPVKFSKGRMSIQQAFDEIQKQTSLNFAYNQSLLDATKSIQTTTTAATLDEVLKAILAPEELIYTIKGAHIVIVKQEESPITYMGSVKDAQTNEMIVGATVLVAGTSNGTTTDLNGAFKISAKKNAAVQVSFVGYDPQTIVLGSQTHYTIALQPSTVGIENVVVTALGIKRSEKALSYNVQQVDGESVTIVKDANFMNSLSGKVAGVTINASAAGTGGATRVVMRGVKSISSNNNALYVIDGVPIFNSSNGATEGEYSGQPSGEGISDINPEDIESMSVLSGPAAAALYGANAAQGVVLITTKKGRSGKVHVTITNNTTFSNPFMMPQFQNTYANRPGEQMSWGSKLARPTSFDPSEFFNTGSNVQNNISLSVGNDKNQTYFSVGTTNSAGIIPNNKYDRYNLAFRNTTNFLDERMTLDVGLNFVLQKDRNMMSQGEYFNPLVDLYLFPRGDDFNEVRMYERYDEGRQIKTQYWPYGVGQNPYWIANRNVRTNDKNRYMLNTSLSYKIADWISVAGRLRMDNAVTDGQDKRYASTNELFSGPKGFYKLVRKKENQTYGDVLFNINKAFENFSLSANIGASGSYVKSDAAGFQGALKDMPNLFNFYNIDFKTGRDSYPIQEGWEEATWSVFASAELGWKSRLYMTVTGRNDWASALAHTKQNSFFYPSVGLSAILSEMISLPDAISFLKLRGSWASVGSPIPRGLSQPGYKWDPATGKWATNTFRPLGELKPERTNSWEAGLSAKFFQNRITFDATYYLSNTKNQTFNIPVSAASGYKSMYVQSGNVKNWGLEFTLGLNNTLGEFNWSSTVTYSMNRSEVVELLDNYYDVHTNEYYSLDEFGVGGIGSMSYKLTKGGSMGDFYVSKRLKRDSEGNILIKNNNVVVENLTKPVKAGSVLPKGNLGFRNDFSYKYFRAGFLLTARFGGDVISITQATLDEYGVSQTTADIRDAGNIAINRGSIDAEKYFTTTGGKNGLLHNYIYSATNVRLQEAYIGVSLPKKWFNNKLDISVSVTGRNLWMLYNKAPFDPETTASTGTFYQGVDMFMQPSLRSYGFNVKIQF